MGAKQSRNKIYPTDLPARLESILSPKKKFMLGIIDPQYDFFRGGALAVTDANDIIGPINQLRFVCQDHMDTFVSQDYHPANHMSFAETHGVKLYSKNNLTLEMPDKSIKTIEQDMWPTHCVRETSGSGFHKDLILLKQDKVFRKGTLANVESYSAFGDEFANKYENTGLHNWLKDIKITDIIIVGLATDYCVYNTALDALKQGYQVHIILSCTRGVAVESTEKALKDLNAKGVKFYEEVYNFVESNKDLLEKISQ